MSPLDRLLAIEEIKQLKARYFRCVDDADWVGFRSVFADDAEFAPPRPPQGSGLASSREPISGGDAFVAYVRGGREGPNAPTSVHQGFLPEIEVHSADTASGRWAMEDVVRWPDRISHGRGYSLEGYVRRDGAWLISRMALVYRTLDVTTLG